MMTREEFIEKWGASMGHGFTDEELSADLDSLSLPPAEGAEENRKRIDGLIKKHISIDTANFEFCAKNNTINGSLLQGIRDVVNEFATLHAQRIAEKMVEDELIKYMAWYGTLPVDETKRVVGNYLKSREK